MRLGKWLDKYAWSQAELARRAGISVSSVSRALDGKPISRRNAEAIVGALSAHEKALGNKKPVMLADVTGLHITEYRHKRTRKKPGETGEETTPGEEGNNRRGPA